jgi:hypothetical protein
LLVLQVLQPVIAGRNQVVIEGQRAVVIVLERGHRR